MSQFVPMTTEDGVDMIINIDQISHVAYKQRKIYMSSGKMLIFNAENFNVLGDYIELLHIAPEEEE